MALKLDELIQAKLENHPTGDILLTTLESGMQMRLKAKRLDETAEGLNKQANEGLKWVMEELGEKKIKADGFGSVNNITKSRTSYDPVKIGDVLLRSGVDAAVIKKALKAGTKKSAAMTSIQTIGPIDS